MGIFNNGLTIGLQISKGVTMGYHEPVWLDFITAWGMRKVFEAVEPTSDKSS